MAGITEQDVERAVDYLRDTAESTAIARATRVYVEEFRKSIKAQIMKEHASMPVSAQEREAYADARYLEHLDALRAAVFDEQKALFLREAASAKLEAYRTQSANYRGIRV
jgi:hypothetical protein